jgi:hypothetical protein
MAAKTVATTVRTAKNGGKNFDFFGSYGTKEFI